MKCNAINSIVLTVHIDLYVSKLEMVSYLFQLINLNWRRVSLHLRSCTPLAVVCSNHQVECDSVALRRSMTSVSFFKK